MNIEKIVFSSEKLSMEDKVRICNFIKNIKNMNDNEKREFTFKLLDELKSYRIYLEKDDANKMFDEFFKGNVSLEKMENKIINIPKRRLIHFYDLKLDNIETKYEDNLLNFVLYEAYLGRDNLLNYPEIREMTRYKVIDESIELEKNLDVPNDFYKIISSKLTSYRTEGYTKQFLDIDYLQELYLYKSNLIKNSLDKEINYKSNEIELLNGKLYVNKKAFKEKKFNSKIILSLPLLFASAATFVTIGGGISSSKRPAQYKTTTNIQTESVDDIENKGEVKPIGESYTNYLDENFLNTEKRYVTEFSDTVDEIFHLKVYDYTDSELSDEELKTIKLDENRLFIDEDIDNNQRFKKFNKNDEIKNLGIYTENAHRDISRVFYEYESNWFLKSGFIYVFLLYNTAALSILSMLSHDYKIEKLDFEGKEKELTEELEKKINELLELYKQKETPKISSNNNFKSLEDIFLSSNTIEKEHVNRTR